MNIQEQLNEIKQLVAQLEQQQQQSDKTKLSEILNNPDKYPELPSEIDNNVEDVSSIIEAHVNKGHNEIVKYILRHVDSSLTDKVRYHAYANGNLDLINFCPSDDDYYYKVAVANGQYHIPFTDFYNVRELLKCAYHRQVM